MRPSHGSGRVGKQREARNLVLIVTSGTGKDAILPSEVVEEIKQLLSAPESRQITQQGDLERLGKKVAERYGTTLQGVQLYQNDDNAVFRIDGHKIPVALAPNDAVERDLTELLEAHGYKRKP